MFSAAAAAATALVAAALFSPATAVSAGSSHSCAVLSDATVKVRRSVCLQVFFRGRSSSKRVPLLCCTAAVVRANTTPAVSETGGD